MTSWWLGIFNISNMNIVKALTVLAFLSFESMCWSFGLTSCSESFKTHMYAPSQKLNMEEILHHLGCIAGCFFPSTLWPVMLKISCCFFQRWPSLVNNRVVYQVWRLNMLSFSDFRMPPCWLMWDPLQCTVKLAQKGSLEVGLGGSARNELCSCWWMIFKWPRKFADFCPLLHV